MRDFLVTKVLHIDNSERTKEHEALVAAAKDTVGDTFIEEDPSVTEWIHGLVPTQQGAVEYARGVFPSASWTRRYNLHWMMGDAIAGMLYLFLIDTFEQSLTSIQALHVVLS